MSVRDSVVDTVFIPYRIGAFMQFNINDYIFYSSGGICQITDICNTPFKGMPDRDYYVIISVKEPKETIYAPVDSDKVYMRHIMTRDEAEKLIEMIPSIEEINEENIKLLKEKYNEAMKTYEPAQWVRISKTIYRRENDPSLKRRLSETERSYGDTAKKYLYGELALALGIPESEIDGYISSRIDGIA